MVTTCRLTRGWYEIICIFVTTVLVLVKFFVSHTKMNAMLQAMQLNYLPQMRREERKTCVVVRTMFPFKHYTFDAIQNLQDGLSNYSSKYELFVRVDETNEVGAIAALNSHSSTGATMNWTSSHVSSIDLSTILDSYPIIRSYLYNESANTMPKKGDCCGRPPMWQLLVPNDVHFVREHKDTCKHVWIVEDDVDVVGQMDDGSEASISKVIMAKDDDVGDEAPFVAIAVGDRFKRKGGRAACPIGWHTNRHTHAFHNHFYPQEHYYTKRTSYYYIANSTDLRWRCTSDGLRRISQDAAEAIEESMLQHSMFSYAETFIHPIMAMNNISIHWWDAPLIKGFGVKVTEAEASEMLSGLPDLSNSTWAMYQRTFQS